MKGAPLAFTAANIVAVPPASASYFMHCKLRDCCQLVNQELRPGLWSVKPLLNELDQSLVLTFSSASDGATDAALFAQMPLYLLRKRALDHALKHLSSDAFFFHLIQRRGFQSNRKETKKNSKENEDQGAVKADIHNLEI